MAAFNVTKTLFWALCGPVLFFALISASHAAPPDWITQPPNKSGMAYGVGSMEIYGNPQAAIARATELARVDLVSQLRVTVSGNFSSTTTARSGSDQASTMQKTMSNHVRSQVPAVQLKEAKVIDTYTDAKHAYVLVELNRTREAGNLELEIVDIDERIRTINEQTLEGSVLQQLRVLLPAVSLFVQRQELVERLSFVSLGHVTQTQPEEAGQIQRKIDQRLDQLVVILALQDDGARRLEGSLMEGLTRQGLRIQREGHYDLLFRVSVTLEDTRQGGSFYSFANARVDVIDGQQRVLNTFSQRARGVSGMEDVARRKAGEALAEQLSEELATTLLEKIR